MIGPIGRQVPAATLGQNCPQMTQRPGIRGISKRPFLGCMNMEWKICVFLLEKAQQKATYAPNFTQSRKSLLDIPCMGVLCKSLFLPFITHFLSLHRFSLSDAPTQDLPPFCDGTSTALVEVCTPSPQVTEHGAQGLHCPQVQFTGSSSICL